MVCQQFGPRSTRSFLGRASGLVSIVVVLLALGSASTTSAPTAAASRRLQSRSSAGLLRIQDPCGQGKMASAAFGARAGTVAFASGEAGVPGDSCVILAHVGTGHVLDEAVVDEETVAGLALGPDGAFFATVDQSGSVALWDADDDLPALGEIGSPFDGRARSVAISPGGNLLASGDANGDITLWALQPSLGTTIASIVAKQSGGSLPSFLGLHPVRRIGSFATGRSRAVTAVAFGPRGNFLASGDAGGRVVLFRVDRPRSVPQLQQVLASNLPAGEAVTSVAVDGTATVVSGDHAGNVTLLDLGQRALRTLAHLAERFGSIESLSLGAGENRVAIAGQTGAVAVLALPPLS
jgi:WD40 repeat protein